MKWENNTFKSQFKKGFFFFVIAGAKQCKQSKMKSELKTEIFLVI